VLVAHLIKGKKKEKDFNVVCAGQKKTRKATNILEPIPEKIDYSLGGYSHRKRWSHTR
jgi:hypothetical protein